MIKKLIVRLQQGNTAFIEVKKELDFLHTSLLICRMAIKTLIHFVSNLKIKANRDELIEDQFLPFIFLYNDLKKNLEKKIALRIGGKILSKCGALDIGLTLPKLKSGKNLCDFLSYLKSSKYFSISNYDIVKQSKYEAIIVVTKCGYCELLKKYNIYELAPFLCKSDEIFFNNYHPNLRFILENSIANGNKICNEVYQWI